MYKTTENFSVANTKSCYLLAFSAIKEDMLSASRDKTGNVPTGIHHLKGTFCRVTGNRNDNQLTVMYFVTHHLKKYLGMGCGAAMYNEIQS